MSNCNDETKIKSAYDEVIVCENCYEVFLKMIKGSNKPSVDKMASNKRIVEQFNVLSQKDKKSISFANDERGTQQRDKNSSKRPSSSIHRKVNISSFITDNEKRNIGTADRRKLYSGLKSVIPKYNQYPKINSVNSRSVSHVVSEQSVLY